MKQKNKAKKLARRISAYERTINSRNINDEAWHKPGSMK